MLLVWSFLRRTIFSLKWWKKHWYLPWIFLAGLVVWVLTAGRMSIASFVKKTNEIQDEERTNIKNIEASSKEEVRKLEAAAEKDKEAVSARTKEKIDTEKKKIKKQQELIRGDGEAINKALNNAIQD
tara:strand:- start:3510 stop:3890 length:381 start_codon:yes stop_codon:yes gene_type:complete